MGVYWLSYSGLFLFGAFYPLEAAALFRLLGAFLRIFLLLPLIFPHLQSLPVDLVGARKLCVCLHSHGGFDRYSVTYSQCASHS